MRSKSCLNEICLWYRTGAVRVRLFHRTTDKSFLTAIEPSNLYELSWTYVQDGEVAIDAGEGSFWMRIRQWNL
jgi:hypothetical protein